MDGVVDRSSPIPLYLQLGRWLESRIEEGTLPVGSRLPSEPALADEFGLNRNTVRQAIGLLVQKGLVEKQKGLGSFVRRTSPIEPIHRLSRMTSFIDDFDVRDVRVENVVLARRREPAGADLAARLAVGPGDPVVRVERLRLADRTPFVLERGSYPYPRFARLLEMDLRGSIYALLTSEFAVDLHRSVQTLRAVRPPRDIAGKLRINQTLPCILIESLAYTSSDQCVEVLQSFYRGDRYLFQVESGGYRRDEARPAAA